MDLETAVKAALEGVEGLRGHVYTAEALRDERLFAFYRLRSQDEPETLDGDSGLPEAELEVHVVADSYRVMAAAAAQAVTALKALRGTGGGGIFVEKVHVSQRSPDLKEMEVNKYRRMYVLRIAYQEGVYEMAKSRSVGTKLKIAASSGETKVEVGGLKSISGIEITADSTDVTDMGNTDGYREYLPGFMDGGEVGVSGYLDGEDGGQDRMLELMNSGDVVDCEIVFPTKIGKSWTFKAGVTKFSTSADVDDAVTFEASLKVSGKPVLAATSA